MTSEDVEEYDHLNTEEEIRFAAIKEQAILLSGEISDHCRLFRDRLRSRQIFGYTDLVAKLYYDIAYANYKYYHQSLVKDNLLSVKECLEKSITQFTPEQQLEDKINIVKEAKYFLDSVCDLYFFQTDIEQNTLPNIPGNAVLLVTTRNPNEYLSYFVENGVWIKDGSHLKSTQLRNHSLQDIEFHNKSGFVKKTEGNIKQIENITKTAQLQRGRASVNIKYYALKRKRKKLEEELEKQILYADEEKDSSLHRGTNCETFTTTNLVSLLSEIIECNLEIGHTDQVEYYMNILRNFSQDKLNEFNLRKEIVVRIREIIACETALLTAPEDDVQYLIVKKPRDISEYNKEIEKWKGNSVLFLYNPTENHWESWFWIPAKRKLDILENSILSVFLKHIYSNKTAHLFSGELLDMLTDENIFSVNDSFVLKSKRTKLIDFCNILRNAYDSVGHDPLGEHYRRVVDYLLREKNKFFEQFSSSSSNTEYHSERNRQNQFPLSLFSLCPGSSIKKLNDRINEKEFFSDILPDIDQVPDLQRSFNFIYNIDWQFCDNKEKREIFLQKWYGDNDQFNEDNPYERKYLFLLIQCDIYFISNFNEQELSEISGNAIILTKIQASNDYKSYFVKDSIWIKDNRINILKNSILQNVRIDEQNGLINQNEFNDQENKNEIEKMITEMKLNRWYFYGEITYGRVSEGFIDQKNELKPLEIYLKNILPNDIRNDNKNKLCSKESQILDHLSEIYKEQNFEISSSSEQYFLKPISKIMYDQQISLNKGIRIYELRKIDHAKDLKTRIQSDRRKSFSCIVKLSNKHYIALFIENEIPDNENYFLRYIYALNSTFEKSISKKLKWFTGVSNQCIYKLKFIQCPKQKLMSEDSLLHAYFNANACQWAFDNTHWKFLKKFFHKQTFSSKENIEKIKQWFVESVEDISISKHIEQEASQQETFEVIEKFKNIFLNIITSYLNYIDVNESDTWVENLGKTIVTIKTFDDIHNCICNIIQINNQDEIRECINDIKRTRDNTEEIKREHFEVDTIVDLMFSILKEYSLNLLSYQERLSKNFEHFEDRLHHATLLNLAKTSNLIIQEKYPACATQLSEILRSFCPNPDDYSHSTYIKFLEEFEKHLENEKMFSNREELLLICKNLKEILENVKTEDIPVINSLTKKSLTVIKDFVERFSKVENSVKVFHRIFQCLLPLCYELLDIPEINEKLKDNIYKYIFYQKQSFDNIKTCINVLFQHIKNNESIKVNFDISDSKQIITNMFNLFNEYIKKNDQRSIHYIGVYLQEIMMNEIDNYMKSLTSFRHETLISIEHFEKELHQFLLNSIRDSIKYESSNNQLASKALSYLKTQNNYDAKISMYVKITEVFNNSIPLEIIKSVKSQLTNTTHSHHFYLQRKINDLTKMLNRFSEVENELFKFSKLFRKCLNNKYDHLSEQEVFSSNGKIQNEIFKYLKQDKNFNDIEELFQHFQNSELTGIVQKCKGFVTDNDEKGTTEISQCLRQCIIDTVENYTTSLLTYRHKALVAFNHFEKNLHTLLSTYDVICNKSLRDYLKTILDKFNKLPNDTDVDYYNRSLEVYKNFVNNNDPSRVSENIASGLIKIFNENYHTLKPYFKEKINNIKNILNSYINWCKIKTFKKNEYIIYEIQTTSGILSKTLKRLKSQYPDCFRPNNEIRIINSNQFYIDIDLSNSKLSDSESSSSESSSSESSSSEYSEVNIVLVSPYQKLVKNKDKFIINTNGNDAKDVWKNNAGKNGIGTDQNRKGNKGNDGCDGKPGKSAGHVYVVANELPKIDVSACGGKGGRGQDGGNGVRGLDGTDGIDADKEALRKSLEDSWPIRGQAWSYRHRLIGTDGQRGGCGGDAGSGGFRGDDGHPGLVKLVSLENISQETSYKNFLEKREGHNGKPGQAGEAGKHGRDGLDYVGISNWKILEARHPRKVDKLKGGRLRSSYRHKSFEKQRFKSYDMLGFEDGENSSRFQNKYTSRNAHRRANVTQKHKHKNQESVKTIHAINRQNVFQETKMFFDQYRNPQKLSYQHWLAPNLNEFLAKMARLEGLPPSEIYALPDIEHDAKQILILKEKFTEIINRENQRLNSEKLNTDQMSIGIKLLGKEILSQYNEYLQQYQIVYQQLQNEIEKIDVNQLSTGLDIRSVEIAKMRSTLNRIINEQRFNQRLIASQRRTDVLIDNPQEILSKAILDRQNIKIFKGPISSTKEWKKFSVENNIIKDKIIKEFNENFNENSLLQINCHFLFELEKILNQENIKQINKDHISNFTNIYLYNLQQGDFTLEHLKLIEKQKQAFFQFLSQLKSLENTSTLDLLIEFCKGIQREYLRHYWLIWISKTLKYVENKRQTKENLFDLLDKIRVANEDQLNKFDNDLKSSFLLLKQFPDYDFDEGLYEERSSLIKSTDKFNEDSNQEDLFQIFQTFSNSNFFHENHQDNLEKLIINIEQLNIIQDFLIIFQHNLNLMNIEQNQFNSLKKQVIKIEKILIQYSRSYLHDIIFNFSIKIMNINKVSIPDEISQSKDLSKLLTFQSSENIERKTEFTVKQQIAAFKTLYQPNLVEKIFQNLSTSSDINNLLKDEELNEFFLSTVNHLNSFDNKTIENIHNLVKTILQNRTNDNLQFLRIVFSYKKSRLDTEKEKQEIELINIEKENSLNEFISTVEELNSLFTKISEKDEIACEICTNLLEVCNSTVFTNFREVSDEILRRTRTACETLRDIISEQDRTKQIYEKLSSLKNQMSEEGKKLIDQFYENIKKTVQYLEGQIKTINDQQTILRIFNEKKSLLDISDKLFSDIENFDDNILTLIINKLNCDEISSEQLYFCIFMKEIYEKLGNYLYFYFRDKGLMKLQLEKEFEKFLNKHQRKTSSDLVLSFIGILNLYEFNFDENIDDSFIKTIATIQNLQNIRDKEVLINLREEVLLYLMKSYPVFKESLKSFKEYIDKLSHPQGTQIENYETILTFLYGEKLYEKSEYVDDIYKKFYKYCQERVTLSSLQCNPNLFNSTIQLMKLINQTHRDNLYFDVNNINHIQFQVILLHILFEEGYPLEDISDDFINLLSWLFQTLPTYESIENIEDINIEIDHIKKLKEISEKVGKLCENKSNDDSKKYTILNNSISNIYFGMKRIYTEKHMKIIFEKYLDATWLGVFIYFPEYFTEDIDEIFKLIVKEPKQIKDDELIEIQDIIFRKVSSIQRIELEKFFQLIIRNEQNNQSDFKNELENVFKGFKGYLGKKEDCDSFRKINPYYVLNFNSLLDVFNDRIEKDGNLAITRNIFIKIQQCLCCFEDVRLAIEKLSSVPQNEWLKTVLLEHILEKFSLIFPHENEIENIRNKLMQIRESLLLLFNNVFIAQYSDQIRRAIYSNKNSIPDYKKINKEKFLIIVHLLGKIRSTKEVLDQLSDASLAVWDTLLYEIEFSQIFNREIENVGIDLSENGVEKALLFLNRIRVQLGIENNNQFLDFFQNILEKIKNRRGEKNIGNLNKLLQAIHYQEISFEQANEIISSHDYVNWHKKIEKLEKDRYANTNKSDRSADEIIKQMIKEQKNRTNVISKETLEKIAKETKLYRETAKKINRLEGDEKSYINQEIQNILNLSSYQNNPEEYIRSHLNDIIPLILYTWSIANKPQFPKDTQIIALLLFIDSHDKGLIEQVRTGEGKTLIVGLTAAFLALCGNAVDIVSSNRDLAIDGEKKCRSFFQLLKIESGHICSEDDDVNHQSYRPDLSTCQGNIVYGEVGAFQRDILEEEFNNKKIFGKRYFAHLTRCDQNGLMIDTVNVKNSENSENDADSSDTADRPGCDSPVGHELKERKKCLIVDEADNMCLDKARHVLYLSHEIQSLKWLETVYIYIWTAVIRKDINNSDEISEDVKDITQFIKNNIENKNIFIPDYMKEFVNYKIERWVNSAFQARFMREDDHFVLDISKTDEQKNKKQKTIIILDKDTGVEQYSTQWSHGLAQFLELKYRRKLSVESLKAVFISNKAFFQRYEHCLYGLTGTIGSENSQSFLSDLYRVRFAHLPTSKEKYFHQISNRISIDYGDWLDTIARETIERVQKQPVLIICENVETTESIWNELIRQNVPAHTIEKYRRDGDNIEDRFAKKPATIGDIIIATNKGGRGTDIHVDKQVNKYGGMHVILSYLPENVRVEEQAFGRTARNGAQGTGQFILLADKSINEEVYDLNQYTNKNKQEKLKDLADVIIEREKILRDNKEAARLSELKQKNILHLEVEEELFQKFNEFKNEKAKNFFKQPFNDKPEEFQKKLADAFENILKNRWAFWLDKAKEKIDAIENLQQKDNLLKKFDSSFVSESVRLLDVSSFDDLLSKFINQPEEAIHIGKVCLSEKDFSNAKKCFEKGIFYGDISGFSHIALTYCMINLKTDENLKKQSRRHLKKALNSLESIKQSLLSNLKIVELLPQTATADIAQKVSSKENLYQDQISGKLEVIGLHLHYLRQAVGETVEPFDFILHPKDEKNLTKEDYEKGKRLYNLLVEKEIIQGDRIRKIFRNNSEERKKMEEKLKNDLDPSIAHELIGLLARKDRFEKKDFEDIVCHNEELWEKLKINNSEKVYILDIRRIERELPEKYENIWKDIENKHINPSDVDISLFKDFVELKNYLEEKQILTQTKRVKIKELNIDSLKFSNKYNKYNKIKFNDNGHEIKDLKTFLKELIDNIRKNSKYVYQTDLPFSTKEEEGNKIRIYLKEKNILKSGGLATYKYETDHEKTKEKLDEILKDTEFQNDKELIQTKILSLQGNIRSCKDDLTASLKDFIDLPDQEIVPNELKYFEGIGLDKFLIIKEDKSWWDWNAFAVAMIGLAQVIAGAVLISFGLVNIGGALISEGISDMIYATMAGLSGNFSWKDWAIQKSISFSLSIMTAGLGKLASVGSTVAKLGSVSRAAMIAKIIGKAALEFATTCLTNIITDKTMEQIQDGVIQKIVSAIEEIFLKGILDSMKNKVESLYTSLNEQKFEIDFAEMKRNIEGALGRNLLLPQQFDTIRTQLISSLQNSYHVITEGLKKSNSTYAKLASTAIEATFMINQLWNIVQPVLQLQHAYHTFISIIEGSIKNKNENNNRQNINPTLVNDRVEQLNSIIRRYISTELTKKLDSILRQIISGTLKQIGKAIAQSAKDMISSEFNGKNPVDVLKRANQSESQVSVGQPLDQQTSKKEQEEQAKREDLQNNIVNPKNSFENYLEEIKDKDRAFGHTDIKMLAYRKTRNIVVYNADTGEKEVIRPSGLRKIPAFFKQSARINYTADKNGGVGHYFTARGKETYIQINGRNDCLIIAYHESLGRKVVEDMIRREREELYRYINQNPDIFRRHKENITTSGCDSMIGGSRQNRDWNSREFSNIRFEAGHNLAEQSSFMQNKIHCILKNTDRDIDNNDFKNKIESTVIERDGQEIKNFKRHDHSERKYPGSHQLTGPLKGHGTFDICHDHSSKGRKTPGSTRVIYRYEGKNKRCRIVVLGVVDDHGDNVKPMKDIEPEQKNKYVHINGYGVKKVNTKEARDKNSKRN